MKPGGRRTFESHRPMRLGGGLRPLRYGRGSELSRARQPAVADWRSDRVEKFPVGQTLVCGELQSATEPAGLKSRAG